MEILHPDLFLQSLRNESEVISKKINSLNEKKAIVDKMINDVKAQRFIDANILKDAVWELQIDNNANLYLDIVYGKTNHIWFNNFDEAYVSNSNHYHIDLGDCKIIVNDSQITIQTYDNKKIKDIIEKYDLKVLVDSIIDDEKLLLKRLSEIQKIKLEIK